MSSTTSYSRRTFLCALSAFTGSSVLLPALTTWAVARTRARHRTPAGDEQIFLRTMELAVKEPFDTTSIGEVMVAIGMSFVGTPYVAHSLEQPGEEQLVINLRGFDCTTFVESVLALARCVRGRKNIFDDFKHQLQELRYRSGVIDGYPSRLHYFTDWIDDNQRKKLVRDVTKEIGGKPYHPEVSYMSAHPTVYRQLREEKYLARIKEAETRLCALEHCYVPKELVDSIQGRMLSGDIIAITTSMEGLDVSHTGLAAVSNGRVKLLHASLSGGAVEVAAQPLAGYLMAHAQQTGIIVVRPLEPLH